VLQVAPLTREDVPEYQQIRAELDASALDFGNADSPAFGVMSKRIHNLLFGEERQQAVIAEAPTA